MSYEIQVKRTIYVSQCECGDKDVRTENPPKERLCQNCGKWVPYKEESYTGPKLTP
jgi:hypothetical protein